MTDAGPEPVGAVAASASPAASTSSASPATAWLRAVLLGSVLIPLTIFVLVAWWGYSTARHTAETAAVRGSTLAYEHARRTLAIALEVAQRTGQITDLPDDEVRAREDEFHRRMADIVVGLPSIVNVNVWDAAGRALARSDSPIDMTVSVEDRRYFTEQRDGTIGIGISDVMQGRQTGKELMNLTIRRPSADGRFRGIVVVSLSPSFFRDYYRTLTEEDPRLASFSLIRIDGRFMARWPPPEDGLNQVPADSPTRARLMNGETAGSHVVPAARGRETRFVAFRRIPDHPLYVVAGFSRAAMIADWTRFLAVLVAIMLPITAGLVWVSWIALKRTLREQAIAAELRDEIRRRSEAERAMLENQKWETLSVLTGGVAHDFNNLLAIVNTSLHVHLVKHPELREDRQVQAMSRAIQSGVRLTRQLLSFPRRQALKPEIIRLQQWLPPVIELIRSTLGPNVALAFTVAPDTAAIRVDPAELELALINLCLNARHALPAGGAIQVLADNAAHEGATPSPGSAPAGRVAIRVIDNGTGIPPELLSRVREPFFTTRKSGAGSGLGLSQVDGLVNQSGGTLHIDSTPGSGTTVLLLFPAVAGAQAGDAPSRAPARSELSGDMLLVEDNDEVAASTQALLAGCGLSITCRTNAQDAIDYLRSAPRLPDVVLSDIAMPGSLSGIDLALRLRTDYPQLPVLLTTGYADQLEVAVEAGLEVLPKPIPPEELLKRLRQLL